MTVVFMPFATLQTRIIFCYAVITMDKRQTVIVCGDSLLLAGVQASLGLDPSVEVIAHPLPITEPELLALQPRAVIFDTQALQPDFRYMLAQELPGLLLIGIDPATNHVLIWSGHHLQELSTQDLVKVITT